MELENGELLIPIYYKSYEAECIPNSCSSAVVLRCSFDGDTIRVLEIGTPMNLDIPRGLDEPSIIQYKNEYFLTLRNDITGYVTKSTDGLTFDPLKELCFDNGENLGSLGNFGFQSFSEELGFIFAAEWMQNDPYGWDKCAQYGRCITFSIFSATSLT